MAKVIVVTNQKGGVGKTTTSAAVSTALKLKGFKVLAVDMDPQANLTFCLDGESEDGPTSYEFIKGEVNPRFAVQRTSVVDLISSNIVLSTAELEFGDKGREFYFKKAVTPLKKRYDYIVVDSPPAFGFLTMNALVAADYVIIPMLADIFSLQGIAQLSESVNHVKKYFNPKLVIGGVLLCRYNDRTVLARRIFETAEMVSQQIGTKIYNTKIRDSVSIPEALTNQMSIYDYDSKSPAAIDYLSFTEELLKEGV